MDAIALIGGGGHARVVLSILNKLNRYRVVGYTDEKRTSSLSGISYLGNDENLASVAAENDPLNAVLSVGQIGLGTQRWKLWSQLAGVRLLFPSVISPDAVVNEGVAVSEAVVVMDGAVINCGAVVGRGAIVNTNSTIEHDVLLGDWVHIAPGATVCGGTEIGRFSMVGAGATIIQGVKIVEGCLIGAGATVVKDLKEAGVYAGCPARLLGKV
jgi:sugar O-acyltransferase (sialic acid O-acetyltransferase NeuD family)